MRGASRHTLCSRFQAHASRRSRHLRRGLPQGGAYCLVFPYVEGDSVSGLRRRYRVERPLAVDA